MVIGPGIALVVALGFLAIDRATVAGKPAQGPVGADHEHAWMLQAVEYDDGAVVEELGCSCGAVWFR